ncbi:hypothetical protein EYF80_010448 [Liparis tanakae]|uniref:Uncharacterized protein n=1 Tax=Liparis tanakae TaxID=230148 RepID=A0A4Z2IP20_9TELE|nr:hypothetical protein EYF80_010448 [Liparis tanakae]
MRLGAVRSSGPRKRSRKESGRSSSSSRLRMLSAVPISSSKVVFTDRLCGDRSLSATWPVILRPAAVDRHSRYSLGTGGGWDCLPRFLAWPVTQQPVAVLLQCHPHGDFKQAHLEQLLHPQCPHGSPQKHKHVVHLMLGCSSTCRMCAAGRGNLWMVQSPDVSFRPRSPLGKPPGVDLYGGSRHGKLHYYALNTRPVTLSTLTFQQSPVNVLVLGFSQRWIFVEQVRHEGEVEFGVSADDVSRGDKLSTAESVGLLEHRLCPLHVVFLLNNTQTTCSD